MKASTLIKVHILQDLLRDDPDKKYVHYLLSGLKPGFHTGIDYQFYPLLIFQYKNDIRTADIERLEVDKLLASELNKGYAIGPFPKPPFANYAE